MPRNVEPQPVKTASAAAPSNPPVVKAPVSPDNSTGIPDLTTIYQILWSTTANIQQANKNGDYSMFWRTISPRLQSELTPTLLGTQFASLRSSGIAIDSTIGAVPTFELAPHVISDGRMRLRGSFDVAPKDVRFDLLYVKAQGLWRLDAIAFAEGD